MKTSWDYNFHSHTYRCGHAEGSDEEYALAAIKAGFRKLGYSDHAFLPGIHEPGMRGDLSELDGYIHSIDILRRRYEGLLDIYVGFEAEYSPELEDYYRDLLATNKLEYLLLGQHSYYGNGKMNWYSTGVEPDEAIRNYTKDLIKGMETGLFTYVNHPDFFLIYHRYWNEVCEECAEAIAKASKRLGVPLEINMAHARYGLKHRSSAVDYPYGPFWDIVAKEGCDVVLGVDAHRPSEYSMTKYEDFISFLKFHELRLVEPIIEHKRH